MMTDSLRRLIRVALIMVALTVIVVGLWPTDDAPPTVEQRTEQIAGQIRCPFCNGESIGDATSQVARDLEVVIEDQVRSGMSDTEIYAYFSDRYGEAILMAPPLGGWGWGLWALPLLAMGIGVGAIWYRRRAGPARAAGGSDDLERVRIETAIAQVDQDLVEVGRQADTGEIDVGTLEELTATYEEEKANLVGSLDVSEPEAAATEPDVLAATGTPGSTGRGPRRLVGAAALVVGAVAITLFAVSSADRADNDATAGVVDAPAIDLDSVTTEQWERHPEALAWLGFISFQVNEPETAENYLVEALELQPTYPQAQWWLANVRYVGLGDPGGAIEPLEALLVFDNLPDDIREAAVELLAQARSEF
jgi:cytochrome c-type biogenesis protein CcmH